MAREKKQRQYVSIELTQDFANLKKGATIKVNSMRASDLLRMGIAIVKTQAETPAQNPVIKKKSKTKKNEKDT